MLVHVLIRELRYRWGGALLAMLAVAAAVALPLSFRLVLRENDLRAEVLAKVRGEQAAARMAKVEKDLRAVTLRMGYNAMIVAPGQDLDRMGLSGIPDVDMAESEAQLLAGSRPSTLNHLLPVLQARVHWEERSADVVLCGAGEQTWILNPKTQVPLLNRIQEGTCVPTKAMAERFALAVGNTITVLGRPLQVVGLRPGRGGLDDRMLWIALTDAQAMLDRPARINAIYALLCQCGDAAGAAALTEIRQALPKHQLVVFGTQARARDEVLSLATQSGLDAAEAERSSTATDRAGRARLALWLGGAGALGAGLVVALVASANAQARRSELAVLRAVGWPAGRVGLLLTGRAAIVGCVGALIGVTAVAVGAALWTAGPAWDPWAIACALGAAPALAVLAALPAFVHAVRGQPDALLRES